MSAVHGAAGHAGRNHSAGRAELFKKNSSCGLSREGASGLCLENKLHLGRADLDNIELFELN